MKKFVAGFLSLALPAVVFAEGSTPTADTTQATTAITTVQTAFETILSALGPAVLAVVIAGVGIWAIPRVVGALKSAFTGGKGR